MIDFKKIAFCFKTTRSKILKKFKQLELSRKNLNLQGEDNLSPIFDFMDGQSLNFERSSFPHFSTKLAQNFTESVFL